MKSHETIMESCIDSIKIISHQELDSDARIVVADENRGVDLEWTVGGAFQVDTTQVGS